MPEKKRRSLIELLTGKPPDGEPFDNKENEEEPNLEQNVPVNKSDKKIKKETVEINDIIGKQDLTGKEDRNKEDILDGVEEGQLTVDVCQTDKHLIVRSTIAGVLPKDIDISLNNNILTIRGKREEDSAIENNNYYYREIFWGSFARTIILPVEVDPEKVEATIKNGILTVRLAKKFEERNKKIEVKAE